METRPEIQEEELSGLWVENAADALGPAWTLQESQLSQREAAVTCARGYRGHFGWGPGVAFKLRAVPAS